MPSLDRQQANAAILDCLGRLLLLLLLPLPLPLLHMRMLLLLLLLLLLLPLPLIRPPCRDSALIHRVE